MYHMQNCMYEVNPCFPALIPLLWSRNIYLLFYVIGSHEDCSWLIAWWMVVNYFFIHQICSWLLRKNKMQYYRPTEDEILISTVVLGVLGASFGGLLRVLRAYSESSEPVLEAYLESLEPLPEVYLESSKPLPEVYLESSEPLSEVYMETV